MKKTPLVSVGFPIYNRVDGLKKTLCSLKKQSYHNLEIIISDNCSPNPLIKQTILQFAKRNKQVKYFFQKKNQGSINNFDFVLKKARGEYFMWAADSIKWDPKFIESCVKQFEVTPQYDLIFTRYQASSPLYKVNFRLNHNLYLHSKYRKEIFLLLDEVLTHKANMMYGLWKRKVLKKVLKKALQIGLNENHSGQGFDAAFMMIALDLAKIYQIQKVLFFKSDHMDVIPGSSLFIKEALKNNLYGMIRNPFSYWKQALAKTQAHNEVLKLAFARPDDLSIRLLFILKTLSFLFCRFII